MCKKEDIKPMDIQVNKRWYSVNDFWREHPGGRVITEYVNRDATDCFECFHHTSKEAYVCLSNLPNKPVTKEDDRTTEVSLHFRELKRKWKKQGLFESNGSDYIYYCVIIAVYWAAWKMTHYGYFWIPAIINGINICHVGYLQHNFGHMEVTSAPWTNRLMQLMTTTLLTGSSALWWRSRHTKHHASPQVHGKDGDLDTVPLLAWSEKLAVKCPKWLLKYQHIYFIPALLLYVPIFWVTQKIYLWRKKAYLDSAVVLLHNILWGYIYNHYSFQTLLAFTWWSMSFSGLYLGLSFALSHFPLPVIEPEEAYEMDWVTLQCETTLDWGQTTFWSWASGHLNYQIEHHLVPHMPCYYYSYIAQDVKEMCQKFDIPYRNMGLWETLKFNLGKLQEVGEAHAASGKPKVA